MVIEDVEQAIARSGLDPAVTEGRQNSGSIEGESRESGKNQTKVERKGKQGRRVRLRRLQVGRAKSGLSQS